MPNFVDTFLKALPEGVETAQRQMQLLLQEEQVKEAKRKQSLQESWTEALMLSKGFQERDFLAGVVEASRNTPGGTPSNAAAQALALARADETQSRAQAQQKAQIDSQRLIDRALAPFKDLGPEDRATITAAMMLGDQVTAEFKNRIFQEVVGPERSETLMNVKRELDIIRLQGEIVADEEANSRLGLPPGTVGSAKIIRDWSADDMEQPDKLFDEYVDFLKTNTLGGNAEFDINTPEDVAAVTNTFTNIYAPVYGKTAIDAALGKLPIRPDAIGIIGSMARDGTPWSEVREAIMPFIEREADSLGIQTKAGTVTDSATRRRYINRSMAAAQTAYKRFVTGVRVK